MPLDSEMREGNGRKHKESWGGGGHVRKSESNKEESSQIQSQQLFVSPKAMLSQFWPR